MGGGGGGGRGGGVVVRGERDPDEFLMEGIQSDEKG